MTDQIGELTGGNADIGESAPDAPAEEKTRFRRLSESLSAEQQRALTLLAAGKSIPEVANAVGVHRATVYRWITAEPYFRAAYNAWQLEQRESLRAVLLNSAENAVERVATMVKYDHKFAWKVAKELGMFRTPATLHTDPQQVEAEIEIERLEEQARLEHRRQDSLSGTKKAEADPLAEAGRPKPGEETKAVDDKIVQVEATAEEAREKAAREAMIRKIQLIKARESIG
jgi:hypothetical protein